MAPPPLSNQTNETNGACWYAIRTRARHEKQVRDRLESQGIEQLLPTVIKLSQWKDRKKKIEVPLFSCYCFARFAWPDRLTAQQTAGVVQIVGNGNGPEPIPDGEIYPLPNREKAPPPHAPAPFPEEGHPAQGIRGPAEGA